VARGLHTCWMSVLCVGALGSQSSCHGEFGEGRLGVGGSGRGHRLSFSWAAWRLLGAVVGARDRGSSVGSVGAWGGLAAVATRGRHRMRLWDPTGRPMVLGLAMFAEGAGELGWQWGGGRGGRMDAWMMVS
jgi:hypothetical protein